jgi:putative ABC transport system ATP-binding protein
LGLRKEYLMRGGPVEALKGIDLEVKKGEYLSIMGPSGSGKTTLFNMIGGLDTPSSGNVLIEGKAISAMSPLERTVLRCHRVGYIFQTFNLIPALSALENVAMPMIFAGLSRNDRLQRARELLDVVGLSDRLDHKPTQLSGGQQQRVAIARAVANEPAIILADEPTGNLDLNTGVSIVQLLYRLKTESNTTVICATHDLKMIDVSDRIAWLTDGRIERVEEKRGITLSASELGNWSWE